LNSINITRVTETKFLGVTLQDNLTWISHINEKCKKISQTLALLKRLKHEVPLRTLKTIYSSLIEPHMIYAITAWGSLSSSYKRLILLQKRALRIINKAKYNSHTEPLFKSSEILKINDHYKLKCCILCQKKMKKDLPTYHFDQLLTRSEYLQINRNTRQHYDIYIHSVSSEQEKRLLNYSVGTIWNDMPENIKTFMPFSLPTFSKHLKHYYLSQYSDNCSIQNCYICSR
jgi:hypothetical protein